MRVAPALLLCLGLVAQTLAQPGTVPPPKPPTPPPAAADKPAAPATDKPAAQPPTPPPAVVQPPPPPAATPVPVPDGPVVKTQQLDGGLIIEDIKIGEGYEVKEGGAVVAFYHGTLKDGGKKFDSAFDRGEPIAFPLSGVIPGWQKGVPGMKVGGIRRLTIPSAMGYGANGAGADIPPNADLIFIIQLVDAIQTIDVKEGEGEAAAGTFVAVTTYSIKDAEGKEVEKADATKPYIWIPNEFQGIQFGLEGMKPGGHRKIHVPKEMNKPNPQLQGTRPTNVPLDIEVDLIAVRNLGRRR